MEEIKTVGYLGPEGSFTHLALIKFLAKKNVDPGIVAFHNISDVIEAVSTGKIKAGLVPIENSIEGSVGETLDQLINTAQKVVITAETTMLIEQCLISKEESLPKIKKIFAHNQALRQCQNYIKRFLNHASCEATSSNSFAVKHVSESKENGLAAIGPEIAAEFYKIPILEYKINDEKENFTRFVLIGTETSTPTGKDKTTIAFGVPFDKPGTLVKVLNAFANENINLSRIESRPSRKALGEYIFYIDLEAHRDTPSLKRALSEIASEFSFYRWLGSYPVK